MKIQNHSHFLAIVVTSSFALNALASETAHTSQPAASTAHSASHAAASPSVNAETALRYLKNGNIRYTKNSLRRDGQSQSNRATLSGGQHPHAIVLSCSDSRVPPELVFDQKLGEIFVVRTAGESLDSMALASIEYAVEHLGPQLLVVMGHSSCGAVKAAFETLKAKTSAGSPHLDKLVADIQPRISSKIENGPSPKFIEESSLNAQGIARDLADRSTIIQSALKSGKLKIVSALYHLDNGMVKFLDDDATSKAQAR